MSMQITTNHHYRPLIYWSELTPKEQADNDWATEEETFFKYKGEVYALSEFPLTSDDLKQLGWQACMATSAFSGILITLSDCGDMVKVGAFYS